MHGTYHNSSPRLETGEMRPLSNGDIVVFGAEVKRGPEIFPACAFRVDYQLVECKATNTYGFPASSDIEDEEQYDISENEFDDEEPSSVDGVSVDSPTLVKAAQSVDAVDLTKDEPRIANPSTPVVSFQERPHFTSPIIFIDSEEDDIYSLDSDGRSEVADSEVSRASEASEASDASGIADVESTDDDFEMRHDNMSSSNSGSDDSDEDSEKLHNGVPHFVRLSTPDVSGSDNEEDQSDFSLSEAGREGIQALFDDGLLSRQRSRSISLDLDAGKKRRTRGQ